MDSPPLAETSSQWNTRQGSVDAAHPQASHPSIWELFAQVIGKAAVTQRLAGTQVSFASARNEALVTFSSHRKVLAALSL